MNQKEKAINQNFINHIKEKIKGSPVDLLMEILPMGKEAIYRRLRGEVLFTLSEAALIAQELRISLDDVAFVNQTPYSKLKQNEDSMHQFDLDEYHKQLDKWVGILQHYQSRPDSHAYMTIIDFMVPMLVNTSELLLKYLYYQTVFENGKLDEKNMKFADFELPKAFAEKVSEGFSALNNMEAICVLDNSAMEPNIKRIKYLHELGVINNDELKEIRSFFYDLLVTFRDSCNKGYTPNGRKLTVYVCEINVGNPFGILENEIESVLFIRLIGVNYRYSSHSGTIRTYKHVFDNLVNLSNLISDSGAVQRNAFFKKQFALLDQI